jgi:hypothetical protein
VLELLGAREGFGKVAVDRVYEQNGAEVEHDDVQCRPREIGVWAAGEQLSPA